MTVNAFSPARVEILGNHTDYNEGYVLLATAGLFTRAAGCAARNGEVRIRSRAFRETAAFGVDDACRKRGRGTPPWADYLKGVIWALAERGIRVGGLEAEIESDIPPGVGLSSSAALELSFCLLLKGLNGFEISRREMAELCRRAENEYVGVPCGILDQFACAFGRRDSLLFLDCRDLSFETVPLPAGVSLVVCDSGTRRNLKGSDYELRLRECGEALKVLTAARPARALRDFDSAGLELGWPAAGNAMLRKRATHVITENERVLAARACLGRGDLEALGRLMFLSHQSSREMFENSNRELDFLVDAARNLPGVIGAKLSGAGWGGATVNLVSRDRADEFVLAITEKFRAQFGREARAYACPIPDGAALAGEETGG